MKKNLFFLIPILTLALFVTSCSKDDTTPGTTTTIVGKWETNVTRPVGPTQIVILNFKAGGALAVDSSSTSTTNLATGTWVLAADSVRATYTYLNGTTGTFSLAGKYSSDFKTMNGTIGTASNTSGYAIFTATK